MKDGQLTKIFKTNNQKTFVLLFILVLLIISVRLYYFTGPAFANTQDEGAYLTTFLEVTTYHTPITFSQYAGANFSNLTNGLFNPAQIFQFYVGFEYPELFLLSIFGYSSNLAIYYVILTSLIEGIFIFLILKKISGIMAGIIGSIIFAFLPVDVIFATQVQPLIPMAMALTISVYLFILADNADEKKYLRRRNYFYLASGVLVGFAYITNPSGLLFYFFAVLVFVFQIIKKPKVYKKEIIILAIFTAGFILAYLPIGMVYFIKAGDFFLYPLIDHSTFLYQIQTQPLIQHCFGYFCFEWATGGPFSYLHVLLNQTVSYFRPLVYFGYTFYIFLIMVFLYVIFFKKEEKFRKWGPFFIAMFVFYYLALSYLPMSISNESNHIVITSIPQEPYLSSPFILPLIVILALGITAIIKKKNIIYKAAGIALIVVIIWSCMTSLNGDTTLYRASQSTLNSFISYVRLHPNTSFYTQWIFANNAGLVTVKRYKIYQLSNCTSSYLANLPNGSDVVTGGTLSISMSSGFMTNYDSCVDANLTGYTEVYSANNTYEQYVGTFGAPPLKIFEKQ